MLLGMDITEFKHTDFVLGRDRDTQVLANFLGEVLLNVGKLEPHAVLLLKSSPSLPSSVLSSSDSFPLLSSLYT
jgi:hypothetical protein